MRSAEADRVLGELQSLTGETLTEAATDAPERVMEEIWSRLRLIPNRDPRPDDETVGYGLDELPR